MKTSFDREPERVLYMPLPNGSADVWLRKNIRWIESESGEQWEADEIYINTFMSRAEVMSSFEALFSGNQSEDYTSDQAKLALLLEMLEVSPRPGVAREGFIWKPTLDGTNITWIEVPDPKISE